MGRNAYSLLCLLALFAVRGLALIPNARFDAFKRPVGTPTSLSASSYLDELSMFRNTDKKCLLGLATDSWNIGTRKYKDFLAVHNMVKRVQKSGIACVEVPMWECAHGPHYNDLQRLLESYWIPDMTSTEQLLLQFDLIVIPDPGMCVCGAAFSSAVIARPCEVPSIHACLLTN